MNIPIAERFHSLQGEGVWVGTPMHFIRLPGCTVGKRPSFQEAGPQLPSARSAWECHTWDGRPFWCDTDFTKRESLPLGRLVEDTWETTVCLTGGEPLMWPAEVEKIVHTFQLLGKRVHLETSGTIPFYWINGGVSPFWTALSPKQRLIEENVKVADEIKLLVDRDFDLEKVPRCILDHSNVFLQPINGITNVDFGNLERCMMLIKNKPNWKLSSQLHKLIEVR